MTLGRRRPWLVLALLALFAPGCPPPGGEQRPAARSGPSPDDGAAALGRAAAYLWAQQSGDGGWHAPTGLLRSGQAMTPFVLLSLLDVPLAVCPRPPGGVERALGFLRERIDPRGWLGRAEPPFLEYPTYATALALRCLARAGGPGDWERIDRMRRALIEAQLGEARGFARAAPAYGGWSFGAEREPGDPGHVDLTHTRHVLQALRASGGVPRAVRARAADFLRLVQRHPDDRRPQPPYGQPASTRSEVPFDGGFYLSPVVLGVNKGRLAETPSGGRYYRSYATATADGLLALLALGAPGSDPRVEAAARWLTLHADLTTPAGIPAGGHEPWAESLRTYHLAVRAEAAAALGRDGEAASAPWRAAVRRLLVPRQRSDGSFSNADGVLMKEDDPYLCTTLAAIALTHALPPGAGARWFGIEAKPPPGPPSALSAPQGSGEEVVRARSESVEELDGLGERRPGDADVDGLRQGPAGRLDPGRELAHARVPVGAQARERPIQGLGDGGRVPARGEPRVGDTNPPAGTVWQHLDEPLDRGQGRGDEARGSP